jgi:GNAT superfamily N-acetyltransferase
VAGWRVVPTTANSSGRRLHVDDLVTAAAHRGSGYGGYLLDILEERARSANCALLELDSGLHRTAAHGFYRARGMRHTCHHYGKPTR